MPCPHALGTTLPRAAGMEGAGKGGLWASRLGQPQAASCSQCPLQQMGAPPARPSHLPFPPAGPWRRGPWLLPGKHVLWVLCCQTCPASPQLVHYTGYLQAPPSVFKDKEAL